MNKFLQTFDALLGSLCRTSIDDFFLYPDPESESVNVKFEIFAVLIAD